MTEQIKIRKRYMNVDEVADYLGFSNHAIRSWIKSRQIPYIKFGRAIRFDTEEIDVWLLKKKVAVLGVKYLSFCLSRISLLNLN